MSDQLTPEVVAEMRRLDHESGWSGETTASKIASADRAWAHLVNMLKHYAPSLLDAVEERDRLRNEAESRKYPNGGVCVFCERSTPDQNCPVCGNYMEHELDALRKRVAELSRALRELYDAMIRYQGDVDGDVPSAHGRMMRGVERALKGGAR